MPATRLAPANRAHNNSARKQAAPERSGAVFACTTEQYRKFRHSGRRSGDGSGDLWNDDGNGQAPWTERRRPRTIGSTASRHAWPGPAAGYYCRSDDRFHAAAGIGSGQGIRGGRIPVEDMSADLVGDLAGPDQRGAPPWPHPGGVVVSRRPDVDGDKAGKCRVGDLTGALPKRCHWPPPHRSIAGKAELAAGRPCRSLVNHPANGFRINGVAHSVEYNLRNSLLPGDGFGCRFIIDRRCQTGLRSPSIITGKQGRRRSAGHRRRPVGYSVSILRGS